MRPSAGEPSMCRAAGPGWFMSRFGPLLEKNPHNVGRLFARQLALTLRGLRGCTGSRRPHRGAQMQVFISHSSKGKPAVEALAVALRQRGIEVWLDKWEIGPGDDIVASINAGLGCLSYGIGVASRQHRNRWGRSARGRLVLRPSATMRLACPRLVTALRQWALFCRRPARRQDRPL
jgi:TIR domain